jgi:hypothetical protein
MQISNHTTNSQPTNQIVKPCGNQIATQFIEYFYSTWIANPDKILSDGTIKPYTKITHKNVTYEGVGFVDFLKYMGTNGLEFTDCIYEILDSRSRQIYILVTGKISNQTGSSNFSQSFMISFAEQTDGIKLWTLMNSLLIIY